MLLASTSEQPKIYLSEVFCLQNKVITGVGEGGDNVDRGTGDLWHEEGGWGLWRRWVLLWSEALGGCATAPRAPEEVWEL